MSINRKGIALVTVAASILVMLIILTTVVVSANGIIENTRKKSFARELRLVQSNFDTYIARNSGNLGFTGTVDITIANLAANTGSQFSDETQIDGKVTLTIVELDKIDVEDVNYGNGENGVTDRYLVSITTGKIYYEKGFKIGSKTYYTLTHDLEN